MQLPVVWLVLLQVSDSRSEQVRVVFELA